MLRRLSHALIAPIVLIIAVLGSILAGVATPTEAAGVGAIGATLLAGERRSGPADRCRSMAPALGLIGVLVLTSFVDLRLSRAEIPLADRVGIGARRAPVRARRLRPPDRAWPPPIGTASWSR